MLEPAVAVRITTCVEVRMGGAELSVAAPGLGFLPSTGIGDDGATDELQPIAAVASQKVICLLVSLILLITPPQERIALSAFTSAEVTQIYSARCIGSDSWFAAPRAKFVIARGLRFSLVA